MEKYSIVACVTTDSGYEGSRIAGVTIDGSLNDIDRTLVKFKPEVCILLEDPDSILFKKVLRKVDTSVVDLRIVPVFREQIDTSAPLNMREIELEDVIGREAVSVGLLKGSNVYRDKRILITGAGGSIGSEICRQLINLEPEYMVLVDSSEHNLYNIDIELRDQDVPVNFRSVLLDITEREPLEQVVRDEDIDIILHAAAYKHVPLLERNAAAAVKNNVIGTLNVARIAGDLGIERFLKISTDKAVNPSSVMGATKRMAELIVQSLNSVYSDTQYYIVRFGNVLGSNGSVVPRFINQINNNQPVTITHPDITRYFMTIPEASKLVLRAAAFDRSDHIFVLDMGQPIKIEEIARILIKISGKSPDKDIPIVYTGLREGEKLEEELFYNEEDTRRTVVDKILLAKEEITDPTYLDKIKDFLENYSRLSPDLLSQRLFDLLDVQKPAQHIEQKSHVKML